MGHVCRRPPAADRILYDRLELLHGPWKMLATHSSSRFMWAWSIFLSIHPSNRKTPIAYILKKPLAYILFKYILFSLYQRKCDT